MPKEVLEYLQAQGRRYGKLGGEAAAANMTAKERLARPTKASQAAARKSGWAVRLKRECAAGRAHRQG